MVETGANLVEQGLWVACRFWLGMKRAQPSGKASLGDGFRGCGREKGGEKISRREPKDAADGKDMPDLEPGLTREDSR